MNTKIYRHFLQLLYLCFVPDFSSKTEKLTKLVKTLCIGGLVGHLKVSAAMVAKLKKKGLNCLKRPNIINICRGGLCKFPA